MQKIFWIYILSNTKRGTLYVGVTSDLFNRVLKHKSGYYRKSFSYKYNLNKLVYYKIGGDELSSFKREKQLKKWSRDWKIRLIEEDNPNWKDLFETLSDNNNLA